MSPAILSKIRNAHHVSPSLGTGNEMGLGFGMLIAKTFIHKLNAELQIESTSIDDDSKYHGTSYIITFKSGASALLNSEILASSSTKSLNAKMMCIGSIFLIGNQ